MLEAPLTA
ncbi:hypothetical protein VTH06DRAFT_8173 [Thermothelomyces fergusii]